MSRQMSVVESSICIVLTYFAILLKVIMGQTSRARGLARLFKAAFEFEKVGVLKAPRKAALILHLPWTPSVAEITELRRSMILNYNRH